MNTVIDPKVQNDIIAVEFSGAVSNTKALDLMDEGVRSSYPYDDLDGFFEANNVVGPPPNESDEYATYADWVEKWEEVKASQ